MIVRVHAKNFKSFDDDTEVCFIASKKESSLPKHVLKVGSFSILRHGAIYGANAAGKTNTIEIFKLITSTVRTGRVPLHYRESFCKSKLSNKESESSFDIQFIYMGRVIAYGFSCVLYTGAITSEYLYELKEGKSEPLKVFERDGAGSIIRGNGITLINDEPQKIKTYEDDFNGNTERLFLKEINTNKKIEKDSALFIYDIAYRYLTEEIITLGTDEGLIFPVLLSINKTKKLIAHILQSFDTGVSDLTWEKLENDALPGFLSQRDMKRFQEKIAEDIKNGKEEIKVVIHNRRGFVLYKQSAKSEQYQIEVLRFKHGESPFSFNFEEESDGTRRLFDILGVLLDIADDRTYVIDELNRSLHPMLSKRFVELFSESRYKEGMNSQLIFSTHEPLLLDEKTLRRDEIWFVERGENNTSSIFPLDQFKKYAQRNTRIDYLDGRYGAIPTLKGIDKIQK